MATTMKYTLKQITDLSFSGFNYEMPEDTQNVINYLCSQVGATSLNNRTYSKTQPIQSDNNFNTSNFASKGKKRKGNKEATDEEWETIRTFQTTKIEQKTGVDADIDQIRLFLNKLTDKTFLDMREKIIEKINSISVNNPESLPNVGTIIYDLCSTNKFYSKIFADLFAELATMHSWLQTVFDNKYSDLKTIYNNIKYVDAEADYDGFCEMNKENERRKSITTFYLNLALNNFVNSNEVICLLNDILTTILSYIVQNDKKAEVDELTENVAILFNQSLLNKDTNDLSEEVQETVYKLANMKAKDYPSLSNKAIFKYMDLIEM